MLGGVEIPHPPGLAGHSDADVLTHAIIDALLGAAGLGDIGGMFPDSDPQYRDARSLDLLAHVVKLIERDNGRVVNVDATLACETPRIAPHAAAVRESLARVLKIDAKQVSVKGKTTEKMGFTGREEGIACWAVVLVAHRLHDPWP